MDLEKRKKNIEKIAKEIISQQYDDTKKFGIENHFLIAIINEMVKLQADKIKSFADFIFEHSKSSSKTKFETKHMECEILSNTDEFKVLTIFDESIYGPNLQNIIVIDDIKNGKFHIRRLNNPTLHLSDYIRNNFKVPGENFVSKDFILTYEYEPVLMRNFLEAGLIDKMSIQDKEHFNSLKKIEEMGDNSFHLYECVVYATGMMADVKNSLVK